MTELLPLIHQVFTAVQAAVHPAHLIQRHLHRHGRQLTIGPMRHNLDDGRLFLVSVGKAAAPMAQAAADMVGDAVHAGIVVTKQLPTDYQLPITDYHVFTGDHPVAGERSVRATTAVTDLLTQTRPGDLVLCLISGGASALLTQPLISLNEWQILNRALLASGCTIQEFNTVRRQLDAVKGGGLARLAAPAQVVSLILSDVIGNDLAAIGSGPTVLVDEAPQDALAVVKNYELGIKNYEGGTAVWQHVLDTLNRSPITAHGSRLTHHPLPTNLLIGSVRQAATAARQSAENSGFTATILTAYLEGEAREAGKFVAAIAKELPPGHCAILGGETTVTVRGNGIGGRNLEVALAAAIALDGWPDVTVATFTTDGDDGPSGAAGAVITGETVGYGEAEAVSGRELHLNARQFLDNNDSFTYFQKLDAAGYGPHLLITGPTGTNVNDLILIFRNP
ncbi:MAG: DUF4147 domain-containing protein [Anaerolineae bacterium]|nr:DUF4147 domain-containing protein [Anaerolineae bacterium]